MTAPEWQIPALGLAAVALPALAAILLVRRRLVVVSVDGISMRPTYEPGDRVLVRRGPARLQRGQVVVIEPPHPERGWSRPPGPGRSLSGRQWYIKRVAAIAGDPVPAAVAPAVGSGGGVVPEASLVVLGDNPRSDDSRRWGYVPAERVLGVVVRRMSGPAR